MKKNILFMIFGMILIGAIGIGVYAINASEIDYNNTKVDQALNYLYTKANSGVLNRIVLKQQNAVKGSVRSDSAFYFDENIVNNYQYFKIIDKSINNYVTSCIFSAKVASTSSNVSLSENTEYATNDYSHMWSELLSSASTNDWARCYYFIELYNK